MASKNHSIGEVSNPTKQALGQRKFPILLFNDTLSSSQVKGRWFVCAPGAPFHKEVFAILAAEFLPVNILLLMPGMTLLNLTAVAGIYFWPEALIRGGGHVVFATVQTIAFLGYLIYVLRFFAAMAPIVLRANQEEAVG